MKFLLGFVSASLLWGGLAFAHFAGMLPIGLAREEGAVADAEAAAEKPARAASKGDKREKRRPRRGRDGNRALTQDDDLGWDDATTVNMAGGEEQLSGSEIDRGFDQVMPRIRRCLILVPADGAIQGQLTFGMRVGGDGQVRGVNLRGPGVVTGGESGSCLRDAAKGIRFASFDGPDMLFNYPINLQ